jgi:hypothetical protein
MEGRKGGGADPPAWWWDDASSWVHRATALSLLLGVWLGWPVLRRAREPYQMVLAVVTGIGYFGLLVVVNFFAYFWSGAPFP